MCDVDAEHVFCVATAAATVAVAAGAVFVCMVTSHHTVSCVFGNYARNGCDGATPEDATVSTRCSRCDDISTLTISNVYIVNVHTTWQLRNVATTMWVTLIVVVGGIVANALYGKDVSSVRREGGW